MTEKAERDRLRFPALIKEIEEERKKLRIEMKYPDAASRKSAEFIASLAKTMETRVGGTPQERDRFFKEVVATYPEVFWTDECAAPKVRGHVIHFRPKDDAVPVARQPIPLSPFDEMRVEFHLEVGVSEGKWRKMDPLKERLPEWSTPVFVVDQDAKGLLGRMVCAYGPVNKNLETATFPSADPEQAFRMAEGRSHHTLVDAIWGYTQFELDQPTKRMLVVCAKSGLYEPQRMPFGPAPAPAHMQSYVHTKFGSLVDSKGERFVSPCMDDLKISSRTLDEHIEHVGLLCKAARDVGFEFKWKKEPA